MSTLRLVIFALLIAVSNTALALPSIIVSANRNDSAIEAFTNDLAHHLPNYTVQFISSNEIRKSPPNHDSIYILMGEDLLRWHMQLEMPPPSIVLKISRVEGQQILGNYRTNNQILLWNDPPAQLQLKLLSIISKRFKRIGIPFTDNSAFLINEIEQEAKTLGLKTVTRQLTAYDNISDLRYLLQRSDVLLGIDDTHLYNPYSIKSILLTSYADRVPLIGPRYPYVDAGALSSVYADQEDWINTIAHWVKQPIENWPREKYAITFKVITNKQVAHSLGLTLPSDNELARALLSKENTHE